MTAQKKVTPKMALNNTQIKNIKGNGKTQKLFDGRGLFLEVTPTGNKRWRLKYRFGGVEKLISLGLYPEVSLQQVRERREDARKQLAVGVNPSDAKKAQKECVFKNEVDGFEVVAREWLAKQRVTWADSHTQKVITRLEKDVFPFIGGRAIQGVVPTDLLEILGRIEKRGAIDTTHRIRGDLGQIFRYGVATARIPSDPSRDLRGALQPIVRKHFAAVTEPKDVAALLKKLDAYRGGPIVSAALRFAPLVFVRPGEMRQALWADINLDEAEWRYLVSKTKTEHIVPLSRQAVAILREIQLLARRGKYVFPSARSFDRPMSEGAVLAALRTMEIPKDEMCGHGFRAMARTILDEVLGVKPELIEHQLAHSVKDALGRSYNRTKHLLERTEMMQKWADYLESLKGRIF